VGPQDIAEVVARWTGIPVDKMLAAETERLLHLEELLRRRVHGQDHALARVASAVRQARAGLSDPNRPQAAFMFLGPTGVGKTELAKALAEHLFDDERNIVRVDMSEYMEKLSVSRLIGAPPGYVGYDEGGQLTEAVRRKPHCVVLLDEIEKAHPDVFNLLLQVLDDGRLTDGQGRTVDFRHAIVLMTSNLGSDLRSAEARDAALKRHFRPEFLNRLDGTIWFSPLGREQMLEITDIALARLARRFAGRELEIEVRPEARAWLADRGFDPDFGARPLRRLLERVIVDPVAEGLLRGDFEPGMKLVVGLSDAPELHPDDDLGRPLHIAAA
jgi:ATP-dependent Clp protease ATP-binding subunit ClpB